MFWSKQKNLAIIQEAKILMGLAIPLIASGLVESSNGFISTMMVARLGTTALAANALAMNLFFAIIVFMWGVFTAIGVVVAQKHGEQDELGVAQAGFDGLRIAGVFAIPSVILLWHAGSILLWFDQDPQIVSLVETYLHGLSLGIITDFIYIALIQFAIGLGRSRVALAFSLLWVPVTIACSYVLAFGKLGFPALGIKGMGWGMSLASWITTFFLAWYLFKSKNYQAYLKQAFQWDNWVIFKELLKIGLPLGLMFCIEVVFFFTASILMGKMSTDALAAFQISTQYLGFVNILSFTIAQAVTVRVGYTIGQKDFARTSLSTYLSMVLVPSFMLAIGLIYWFMPERLIALDIDPALSVNLNVVNYAKHFLAIAAIFQIVESFRLTVFGGLRGMRDTKFTMYVSLLTFWGIMLPIGYMLAFWANMQGQGIWWGMVIGAVVGAAILIWRFYQKIASLQEDISFNEGALSVQHID